ncbi:MAG: TonB-dependent receptor domain-containing protein [Steroidobacteraceae bacterium]
MGGDELGHRRAKRKAAQAQGVEAEVNWKIGGGFSTTLGYTWADSVYKSNPTDPLSVGQQLTDVPRNTASAALTYQNSQGWRVSTDALWVSATSWANADHTNPGFPYQAAADPHFVMDVAATYPVRESLEIYLQVQNLLDRHYIVNPGPFNPPEYGTPFLAFVGVRVTLK